MFFLGGEEASRDAFPYKCAIYISTTVIQELNFCSGSIISEKFALSAAHCLTSLISGILIAGVHNLQEDDPPYDWDFQSKDVIVHEHFNVSSNSNDIALINTTTNPFNFMLFDNIKKINLAPASMSVESLVGTLGRIGGW